MGKIIKDGEYKAWLVELKSRIRNSQIKAAVRINSALIELYWSIGADITVRQAEAAWGSGILKHLSSDLRAEFPNMQGFFETNLKYFKRFYLFYTQDDQLVYQVGAVSNHRSGVPKGHQVGDLLKLREQGFFIDLLFYHLELRCYVVIELKAGVFEAEHTGKLGLYISAINHQRKKDTDNPTIGLLICKTKDSKLPSMEHKIVTEGVLLYDRNV